MSDAALNTLANYHWDLDARDRVTQFDSSTDGSVNYNYDDRGQIEGADYTTGYGGGNVGDESYTYDENGNRTDYTTGDHNRVANDGTYTYTFDDEGNITRRTHIANDTVTIYHWDHRNRLVAIFDYGSTVDADADQNATQIVKHTYDANNRWISRHVDSDGDGTGVTETDDTWFIYDGNQVVYEFNAPTGDGDGNIATLKNRYLWGPKTDEILASEETASGDVIWPLTDNLGTVRDLVTYDSGTNTTTSADHFVYDSFGKQTSSDNGTEYLIQFTGRLYDFWTKHQNNLNRWYDSHLQRFLSPDPIMFAAGDANVNRYAGNSPMNAVDPDGLETFLLWPQSWEQFADGPAFWVRTIKKHGISGIGRGLYYAETDNTPAVRETQEWLGNALAYGETPMELNLGIRDKTGAKWLDTRLGYSIALLEKENPQNQIIFPYKFKPKLEFDTLRDKQRMGKTTVETKFAGLSLEWDHGYDEHGTGAGWGIEVHGANIRGETDPYFFGLQRDKYFKNKWEINFLKGDLRARGGFGRGRQYGFEFGPMLYLIGAEDTLEYGKRNVGGVRLKGSAYAGGLGAQGKFMLDQRKAYTPKSFGIKGVSGYGGGVGVEQLYPEDVEKNFK